MTIQKAIKGIDYVIGVKTRAVKRCEELMGSWSSEPEDYIPKSTGKALIEYIQNDIYNLRTIKKQLKPKRRDSKK